MASSKALIFVNSVWTSFLKTSGMEPHLLKTLQISSASPGKVTASLTIEPYHCNRLSILHGGVLACLVDTGGSLAVASRGLYSTGVSTDLSVTYIKSAGTVGDTIHCTFLCDSLGKTLAYTRVEFFTTSSTSLEDKGDSVAASARQLVARGSHTKYVAFAQKHELNITDELKPEGSTSTLPERTWNVPV